MVKSHGFVYNDAIYQKTKDYDKQLKTSIVELRTNIFRENIL